MALRRRAWHDRTEQHACDENPRPTSVVARCVRRDEKQRSARRRVRTPRIGSRLYCSLSSRRFPLRADTSAHLRRTKGRGRGSLLGRVVYSALFVPSYIVGAGSS